MMVKTYKRIEAMIKNTYTKKEDCYEVELKNNSTTVTFLIDLCDYDRVRTKSWSIQPNGKTYYAVTDGGGMTMHRFIIGPKKGLVVDHINGCGSDNRRSNLRTCTNRQNIANTGPSVESPSGGSQI